MTDPNTIVIDENTPGVVGGIFRGDLGAKGLARLTSAQASVAWANAVKVYPSLLQHQDDAAELIRKIGAENVRTPAQFGAMLRSVGETINAKYAPSPREVELQNEALEDAALAVENGDVELALDTIDAAGVEFNDPRAKQVLNELQGFDREIAADWFTAKREESATNMVESTKARIAKQEADDEAAVKEIARQTMKTANAFAKEHPEIDEASLEAIVKSTTFDNADSLTERLQDALKIQVGVDKHATDTKNWGNVQEAARSVPGMDDIVFVDDVETYAKRELGLEQYGDPVSEAAELAAATVIFGADYGSEVNEAASKAWQARQERMTQPGWTPKSEKIVGAGDPVEA